MAARAATAVGVTEGAADIVAAARAGRDLESPLEAVAVETAVIEEVAVDPEDVDAARARLIAHLDRLAARSARDRKRVGTPRPAASSPSPPGTCRHGARRWAARRRDRRCSSLTPASSRRWCTGASRTAVLIHAKAAPRELADRACASCVRHRNSRAQRARLVR